jgi:hypothetical protein
MTLILPEPKMDARAVRALWVASAIARFEEPIGRDYLAQPNGRGGIDLCIKGILAMIAVEHGIVPAPALMFDDEGRGMFMIDGSTSLLSDRIRRWAGGLPMMMNVPLEPGESVKLYGRHATDTFDSNLTVINDKGLIIHKTGDMLPYLRRALYATGYAAVA